MWKDLGNMNKEMVADQACPLFGMTARGAGRGFWKVGSIEKNLIFCGDIIQPQSGKQKNSLFSIFLKFD